LTTTTQTHHTGPRTPRRVQIALGQRDGGHRQLDYFEERAHALEPGAQIVLCSAKPTWTATHHDDPTAPDVLTSTAPARVSC